MSELKAYIGPAPDEKGLADYYIKSEADKVIAEKDEKIEELEEHIDELQKATDSAWSKVNVYYDELRHSNRKRCLAMARWCNYWANYYVTCEPSDCGMFIARARFYRRWRKRWRKLADESTWAKFLQLIHKEVK